MAIEINGKVYRNLQEQVEKNKDDIEEILDSGFVEYSAGDGIDIEEGVISVDDTVALKSELFSGDYDDLTDKPDLTVYATKSDLNGYIKKNDDTYSSIIKGEYLQLQQIHASGTYYTTTYNTSNIVRKIHQDPSVTYTLNIPAKDGTLAVTSDIPTYTAGTGIDITNNEVSIDNTVALKTDIPTVPTKTSDLQNDSGFITSSDIPSLTNYVTLDGTQTITGVKTFGAQTKVEYNNRILFLNHDGVGCQIGPVGNAAKSLWMQLENGEGDAIFTWYKQSTGTGNTYKLPHTDVTGNNTYTLATTADIPTLSGLTMYNYKITLGGLDSGTSGARSAVYIITLPYQWDYSQLTKYDIIRLVPVYSVVADTATSSNKGVGVFSWQTGTIAQIRWTDGTYTLMDFTGSFNATVEAASPTHW